MANKVEFCGAFQGIVTLRDGETIEQAAERVEQAMQKTLDRNCARLHISIGIDYGDLKHFDHTERDRS